MGIDHISSHLARLFLTVVAVGCLCSCSPDKAITSGLTGKGCVGQSAVVISDNREAKSSADSSLSAYDNDTESTNTGLMVKKACLIPETQNNSDLLKVVAEGRDKDGKPVSCKYEWSKNGEYAGDTDRISGFRRGDRISVKITPCDGINYGQPRILSAEINKSTPKLIESKQVSFDGNVLVYQVKAMDPDGYPITYSLIDAPQGMEIDKNSGLIKWLLPENASGNQSVNIKISDNAGADIAYAINIPLGSK